MYSKYSDYMVIAKQLGYSREVIERIRNAQSDMECERILCQERQKEPKRYVPKHNHKGTIRFVFKRKE